MTNIYISERVWRMNYLYNKKHNTIDLLFEEQKYSYLFRAGELKNPFYASFYEQCIESTVADAYEIFLETNTENNYFQQQIKKLDKEAAARFFRIMAIHHSIYMMRKRRRELFWEEMRQALFFVYNFSENEKKLADVLYERACNHEVAFPVLFSKATARYLFYSKTISPFSLAFIENFCYNSYNSFLESFTRYLSIKMRLKKAAN
jgi:hypothetical protein